MEHESWVAVPADAAGQSARAGVDTAEPPAAAAADEASVPSFLQEVARTLQAATERERDRIATDLAGRFDAHVEQVRVRGSDEAEELRRIELRDEEDIREWSAAEVERIQLEAESRIDARQSDLQRVLSQQDATLEREIAIAAETVQAYRANLDGFVIRLSGEHDPVEIARLVSELPQPPQMEDVASAARAEAKAEALRSMGGTEGSPPGQASSSPLGASTSEREAGLIGVMDPGVRGRMPGAAAPLESAPVKESPEAPEGALVRETTLAQGSIVLSMDDDVETEQERQVMTARRWADVLLHYLPVILLVAIVAVIVVLLVTGLTGAAPGIT
jgi:hypothetical protein